MKRIHNIKLSYKSNVLLAIGINIIFLGLAILFCDIKYEVSDDFVMASIMSGAYGDKPNPQLIFVNTILGYILVPLYNLFPEISWYLIFQILLCFFAFVLVTYMLIEKNGKSLGILLTILLLTFFSDDVYVLPQFTKTASLAFMAGAIVFLWTTFLKKSIVIQLVSGTICVLGSMVRYDSVYLMGSFILLILLHEFTNLWRTKRRWKELLYIVILGSILTASILSMKMLELYTYHNDEKSNYFFQYNNARSAIVDQVDYGYAAYAEELKKIGVSEVDYYMLKTWNFDDKDYFTLKKMEQVARIISEYNSKQKINIENIYQNMQTRGIIGYPIFLACLILLMLSICMNKKFLWCFGMMGIGIVLECYFFVIGRVVYRVEYGIFAGICLGSLYFWESKNLRFADAKKYQKKIRMTLMGGFLLIQAPLYIRDNSYKEVAAQDRKEYIDEIYNDSWEYDARKYRSVVNKTERKNGLLEEIENHPENFYFLDFTTAIQSLYFEWSPFENLPRDYYKNSLYLGGIMTNLPCVNWILEERGIESPIQSLVQDHVYLIDNCLLQIKLDYLRQHYYPEAKAELYKEVDGYQIWKIYVK